MQIYHSIEDFSRKIIQSELAPYVSLGGFDGVHTGHVKILKRLTEIAVDSNNPATVITFKPHPRLILYPENDIKILTTNYEKVQLIKTTKIENLVIIPFTSDLASMRPEHFIRKILIDKFHIKGLVLGFNHHFGNQRIGDSKLLENYAERYNFTQEVLPELTIDNESVSSTKIRKSIAEGNISRANQMLGYEYNFSGKIIVGKKLGRTLGYPTANLEINDKFKLIPPDGIYAVKVLRKDEMYYGMLYVGTRPSIQGAEFAIEVNIFDFDEEIYGESLTVFLLDKIRDDKKFETLEELKTQIGIDKKNVSEYLENYE